MVIMKNLLYHTSFSRNSLKFAVFVELDESFPAKSFASSPLRWTCAIAHVYAKTKLISSAHHADKQYYFNSDE